MKEDKAICRICLEEGETITATTCMSWSRKFYDCNEPLISPCHCRGSIQYVHLSCLQSWRSAAIINRQKESGKRCEQCGHEYQFQHNEAWRWLLLKYNMGRYLLVSTTMLTVLTIHLLGYLMYGWTSSQERYTFGERLWIRPFWGFEAFFMETYYGQVLSLGTVTTLFLLLCIDGMERIWEILVEYRQTRKMNRLAMKKFALLVSYVHFMHSELTTPTSQSISSCQSPECREWELIGFVFMAINGFMYYLYRCIQIVLHLRSTAQKLRENQSQ